jgi:beta-glucanase (GH16 family)
MRHTRGGIRYLRRASSAAALLAALVLPTACGVHVGQVGPAQGGQSPSPGHAASSAANTNSTSAPTAGGSQGNWQLSWSANFDGTGSPQGWSYTTGGYGFGDQELQWFTPQNGQLNGAGELDIEATRGGGGNTCWYGACQYSSAQLTTLGTFSQEYGIFEARIRIPSGAGIWPAFWLEPEDLASVGAANSGELDIIEVNGTSPYLVAGYAHAPGQPKFQAATALNQPISNQFHVYGITWTPEGITWTLDGQPYGYLKAYPGWPFNRPFYIILDLAVGGLWPGPPNAQTVFPAQMLVSWVRVYRQAG